MKLPNRRLSMTRTVKWGEKSVHVSAGYNPETGLLCEVFAYGPKSGSEASALLTEICIERSKAIQNGTSPDYFAQKCIRNGDGSATSISGVVADALAMECADWNREIARGAENTQPGLN